MAEYVGLDVSKEEISFCVMDEGGRVLARGKVASDPDALCAPSAHVGQNGVIE